MQVSVSEDPARWLETKMDMSERTCQLDQAVLIRVRMSHLHGGFRQPLDVLFRGNQSERKT
jgi:hypothetical protein